METRPNDVLIHPDRKEFQKWNHERQSRQMSGTQSSLYLQWWSIIALAQSWTEIFISLYQVLHSCHFRLWCFSYFDSKTFLCFDDFLRYCFFEHVDRPYYKGVTENTEGWDGCILYDPSIILFSLIELVQHLVSSALVLQCSFCSRGESLYLDLQKRLT